MWNTENQLVGQRVLVYTDYSEAEVAIVLAVADDESGRIRVSAIEDGEIMVGNQYEDLD